ncbi:IucA/IucC family protein [Bacillus sp. RO1]|uniref:IucA/IucC family protein n=1 Tax=Bacillus sp. RO1 TaxID=2722703 RepID=UPI00145650FF|nr:IucA/IucC family protein [Bacillus sp. RO1]NLP52817.1 hypothetical protein [Bacillus sp. RO1]
MSILCNKALEKDLPKRYLPFSEKRILAKLVQAVIRENVIETDWTPDKEKAGGVYKLHTLNAKGFITIPVKQKYLLGQLEIKDKILHALNGMEKEIKTSVEFLQAMFGPLDLAPHGIKKLHDELQNSIRNDALAMEALEKFIEFKNDKNNILDMLLEKKKLDPSFSPLTYLEQSVIEGHTLHPCSKTRLGLSIDETRRFAPEWRSEVDLVVLAIHKDVARITCMEKQSITEILLSDYPELHKEYCHLTSYELLPVHPWQYEHTIRKHYQKELIENRIIPLHTSIRVRPLMSFRSMAPTKGSTLHHIKTAVNIQMTSAKRTVSPASVHNGPVLSKLLKDIEQKDPFIKGKAVFLSEIAGCHFKVIHPSSELDLEKNLSCIIRENPEAALAPDKLAIPAAALLNKLPFSKGILIKELVESYAISHRLSPKIAAMNFVEEYGKVLIPVLIHLIVKYGISMEAHLQNAIIIFRKGQPVELMIRDNGGIRIHQQDASSWLDLNQIDQSTNILTDQYLDLYKMFSHAVIHNHLGELIVILAKEFSVGEIYLWRMVKQVIKHTFQELYSNLSTKEQAMGLEAYIFSSHTHLKALISMRLSDTYTENMYVEAPNPLIVEREDKYDEA